MRHPARSVAAGGVLIVAVLGFLIFQGISNNLVYYMTPSELLARGPSADTGNFRLGGQVKPGSQRWNAATRTLHFILQDPKAAVPVVSHGLPPEMFRAGFGVVVEGTFNGTMFNATTLMVKHCAT
ncbi:MAG: cytochrome c maturation protein CcmE, partial [Chloroflexota bacterium]|nr:cytochrome c maturation protein CcmE [Chloroflexota bacterium]